VSDPVERWCRNVLPGVRSNPLPTCRSPRWLVSRGRITEARAVLLSLRGDEVAAETELEGIQAAIEESREWHWLVT